MSNGLSRLATRFWGKRRRPRGRSTGDRQDLLADAALEAGLVTFTPDDIDWDDDVRMMPRRAPASPDALTAMEANLRFAGPETMETKIFGRLTTWQNWVFQRPERSRPGRRTAPLRHRIPPELRPRPRSEGEETTITAFLGHARAARAPLARWRSLAHMRENVPVTVVDIESRIPNNVGLAADRRLQRALESWQPKFIEWWKELGPVAFQGSDVYLRTAISVGQDGWANFGHVKMPDYRWGIFLAEPEPDRRRLRRPHRRRRLAGGARRVLPICAACWSCRATPSRPRRAAAGTVPQRTEPVRPAQPVPGERRGRPSPVGDGLPAAPLLRS